jgi:glucosamine kinase
MEKIFYVGIDGGASKTDIVIKDVNDKIVSHYKSGPSNISVSMETAYNSIYEGLVNAFKNMGYIFPDPNKDYKVYAGLGLAGLEDIDAYNEFVKKLTFFDDFVIKTDSFIACLGAHNGRDGIIVIIGTGSVAFALYNNESYRVGGWGFPFGDEGSGAWIGCEAVRRTLYYYDGRIVYSDLFKEVLNKFDNNVDKLISWAAKAKSTEFASLVPIVLKYYDLNENVAVDIIYSAKEHIESLVKDMDKKLKSNKLGIALIGGVSKFIAPLFDDNLKIRLREPVLIPSEGGILLIKKYLNNRELFNNKNNRW